MTKLTDLEICKRLAEIDGAFKSSSDGVHVAAYFNVGTGIHTYESVIHGYNPLTDDALCFKLMVNHYIEIGLYGTWYGCFKGDKPKGSDGCLSYELNINKAICLAIIEAHK